METRRLKNIAILILLLLNLFLLLLLGYHYLQSRQARADSAQQLRLLLSAEGVELSDQVDLDGEALQLLTLSRQTESEAALAAFLLGEQPQSTPQGGGIIRYTGTAGTLYFRAGGSFDSAQLTLPVTDPAAFAQAFCDEFGYLPPEATREGNTFTFSARRQLDGVPVDRCTVTLTFTGSTLTGASGSHISLENAQTGSSSRLTCVTALVRWLDHWRTSGVICRRVEDVRCVYQLQSSSSSLTLVPVWQVDTDTYTYYVDCLTGLVTRR